MAGRALRVLIACDKFRGSLTAVEANAAILEGLTASGIGAMAETVPIADGGEGTLAALHAQNATMVERRVAGPFGTLQRAAFSYDPAKRRAVIEMAAVAGHRSIGDDGYDPDRATSAGVGELILAALEEGAREIVVAVGGSVTVDGGAGALVALGARVFDTRGAPLERPAGRHLRKVARIERDGLDARLATAKLILAADVDNPLVGMAGAAAVFGPQKGVRTDDVAAFDDALGHFAERVATESGQRSLAQAPHAGAAGGMLVGLSAAFGEVEARDGFALVAEHHGLRARLAQADLLVTGEGSLDRQSLGGKGPVAIAAMASESGTPAIAFAGRLALSAATLQRHHIIAFAIGRGPQTLEAALAEGHAALRETAESVFRALALPLPH